MLHTLLPVAYTLQKHDRCITENMPIPRGPTSKLRIIPGLYGHRWCMPSITPSQLAHGGEDRRVLLLHYQPAALRACATSHGDRSRYVMIWRTR